MGLQGYGKLPVTISSLWLALGICAMLGTSGNGMSSLLVLSTSPTVNATLFHWFAAADGGRISTITFLDYFYLPQGDPADTSLASQQADGIEGWIIASRGRVVAVVGPSFARHFEFLNYTEFIEIGAKAEKSHNSTADTVQRARAASERHSEGVLFVIIAGSISKLLIPEAFSSWGAKDSFIDVGSALDGYAGQESKDFIKGQLPRYCANTKNWSSPDGVPRRWMTPGVCERVEALEEGKRINRDPPELEAQKERDRMEAHAKMHSHHAIHWPMWEWAFSSKHSHKKKHRFATKLAMMVWCVVIVLCIVISLLGCLR